MNESTSSVFGIVVLLIVLAANIFSIAGTVFLIYSKIKPQPTWKNILFITWRFILALAILAFVYLVGRHFSICEKDTYARLTTYAAALTFLPMMISGLIALFFKP